jgi:fructoselysine 6-kinase
VSIDFSELQEPELARLLGGFVSVAFVSRGESAPTEEIDQAIAFFQACGTPEVVVTLGSSGSVYSVYKGTEVVRMPALPIVPTDTLGAGDAFIAGWLFGRLCRDDTASQLQRATRIAANTCLSFGAWPQAGASQRIFEKGSI